MKHTSCDTGLELTVYRIGSLPHRLRSRPPSAIAITTRISSRSKAPSATETVIVSKCGKDQESSLCPSGTSSKAPAYCCHEAMISRFGISAGASVRCLERNLTSYVSNWSGFQVMEQVKEAGQRASSLIGRISSLMARFNSLLGRNKFPVPMRRELRCNPLLHSQIGSLSSSKLALTN